MTTQLRLEVSLAGWAFAALALGNKLLSISSPKPRTLSPRGRPRSRGHYRLGGPRAVPAAYPDADAPPSAENQVFRNISNSRRSRSGIVHRNSNIRAFLSSARDFVPVDHVEIQSSVLFPPPPPQTSIHTTHRNGGCLKMLQFRANNETQNTHMNDEDEYLRRQRHRPSVQN